VRYPHDYTKWSLLRAADKQNSKKDHLDVDLVEISLQDCSSAVPLVV
jgi:hypothetical protein